jgi:hypothetical protein
MGATRSRPRRLFRGSHRHNSRPIASNTAPPTPGPSVSLGTLAPPAVATVVTAPRPKFKRCVEAAVPTHHDTHSRYGLGHWRGPKQ